MILSQCILTLHAIYKGIRAPALESLPPYPAYVQAPPIPLTPDLATFLVLPHFYTSHVATRSARKYALLALRLQLFTDNILVMATSREKRISFFPKTDATLLSSNHGPPPAHPQTVGPIFDPDNIDRTVEPWPVDVIKSFYPPPVEAYAPALIPQKPMCLSDRYLRAFLAKNERLRLSMLWYYTRDILKDADELLAGLQEKTCLAQESTGWEFVVIGILDVNFYIRLATIGLPLGILPRGETICAHTVTQPPGVCEGIELLT